MHLPGASLALEDADGEHGVAESQSTGLASELPASLKCPDHLVGVSSFDSLVQGVRKLFDANGHSGPWAPRRQRWG